MPPCHRYMVIATNLSSLFDLLHCSTPQTRAECGLELTAVSGCQNGGGGVWGSPPLPMLVKGAQCMYCGRAGDVAAPFLFTLDTFILKSVVMMVHIKATSAQSEGNAQQG